MLRLQILPQWPQLDMNLAPGLQASASSQQPVGFQQGMHVPFMAAPSAPGPSPALATLPSAYKAQAASMAGSPAQIANDGALPKPGGDEPQVAEQMPLTASDMAPGPSAAVPESWEPAEAPGIVPASEGETGVADMQTPPEGAGTEGVPSASTSAPQHLGHIVGVVDDAAQDTEGSHPAGQAGQPENADDAPGVATQTEEAENPGFAPGETGSQSNLAALVSASILASNATPMPPALQAAAPACHASDSTHHDPAEASALVRSGLVGSEARSALGMGPAQDDISQPIGQAEASKLIGIRDDLDQLGPAQPDVPCCGRRGSHAERGAGAAEEAHPEQASGEEGAALSSPPLHSAEQTSADLPSKAPAEQPSKQGVPDGGTHQHAAEQQPEDSLQHVAPDGIHADSITEAPALQLSQQRIAATDSAPYAAASEMQVAVSVGEVSMRAQTPEHSEAIPADSSAIASKPVAGHLDTRPDQETGAAAPPAPTDASQGSAAADRLPERLRQPVLIGCPSDYGNMQQPIAPHLFDPTALLAKAQTPALPGLSEHSSPPRNIDIRAGEAPGEYPHIKAAIYLHCILHQDASRAGKVIGVVSSQPCHIISGTISQFSHKGTTSIWKPLPGVRDVWRVMSPGNLDTCHAPQSRQRPCCRGPLEQMLSCGASWWTLPAPPPRPSTWPGLRSSRPASGSRTAHPMHPGSRLSEGEDCVFCAPCDCCTVWGMWG